MFKQRLETDDLTGSDSDWTTGKKHKAIESIVQMPLEYFSLIRVFSAVSASQSLWVTDSTCYVMQRTALRLLNNLPL